MRVMSYEMKRGKTLLEAVDNMLEYLEKNKLKEPDIGI